VKCADVTWDMGDGSYEKVRVWEVGVGALLWNTKGGGHVLVREAKCGEPILVGDNPYAKADCGCNGWIGPCSSTTLVCECGEDNSWRDHHYEVLALNAPA